ncbi:MAG TPA: MobF family relaxase [Acidimicrobiales bacterium]|nr:MobF family relaxase [Acidimicrobiales bacterium]
MGRGSRRHKVPGWDLCTSAPKSVSILAALGDPAVSAAAVESHDAATAAALSYLESVVNEVRRGTDGVDREPAVPGFVGAAFRHREARPCKGCSHGDPQLHTHTVIANIQQSATDGKWFAVDGKVVGRHEKVAGYLYQSVLRHELTERLGVKWTPVVNGLAEISGMKTAWLAHFSKRVTAAAEWLVEAKIIDAGPAAWQRAVLATRLPKGERLDEATLREKWATEAEGVGLTPDVLTEALARSGQRVTRETDWNAVAGRILGVDGLTANEATFCRYDVLRELAGSRTPDMAS